MLYLCTVIRKSIGHKPCFLVFQSSSVVLQYSCVSSVVNGQKKLCITRNLEKMFDYVYIDKKLPLKKKHHSKVLVTQ